MKNLISIFLISGIFVSCTPYYALQGTKQKDLDLVTKGQDKLIIDRALGKPIKEYSKDKYKMAVYRVRINDEPNVYRAIGHAGMDLATLFLWEFVGMYTEKDFGEEKLLTIYYDKNDKLLKSEYK